MLNIWQEHPPFDGDTLIGEKIIQVSKYWVVCRKDENPTEADIDAVLNPPEVSVAPTPDQIMAAIQAIATKVGMASSEIDAAMAAPIEAQAAPIKGS